MRIHLLPALYSILTPVPGTLAPNVRCILATSAINTKMAECGLCCLSIGRHRQQDRKRRALTNLAFNLNLAVVGSNNRLGNRQPKPRFGPILLACWVNPIKPIKDIGERILRNPLASIAYNQVNSLFVYRPHKLDLTAFRGMSERIADQVAQYLNDTFWITLRFLATS